MLKQQLKHALKPVYLSAKRKLVSSIYSYGPEQLAVALENFGIKTGDALMIHSGFSQFNGFTSSPEQLIEQVLDILGPDGNLLMMSMTYGGSSQRYAQTNSVFDVAKSPSVLGLISETFRRRGGVMRSANPLHPIVASGPLAGWLIQDHEKISHSCGRRSPFARFLKLDGKFLFFDAVFRSLTFVHYIEDRHADQLPVTLYDPVPATMSVKMEDGTTIQTRRYLFSAEARERRNFAAIENAMLGSNRLLAHKLGNTRMLFCRASDVVKTTDELLQSGEGYYI